jgi:hypothetical protein
VGCGGCGVTHSKTQAAFKRALAEAIDSLGVSLDHTAALITEKRSIFARNDAVVKQVVGAAPWAACLALPRRLVPYALAAAAAAAAAAAVWIWRGSSRGGWVPGRLITPRAFV